MTDTQIIAIVGFIPLVTILFNRPRTLDLRDINRHIDDKFALINQQMKQMEDNIMRIVGDHETRIQKLEQPKLRHILDFQVDRTHRSRPCV